MSAVTIDQPERMNLLGLMLADVIERNAATPAGQRALARLAGEIVIGAGRMQITLRFGAEGVTVVRDVATEHPAAALDGSLDTLLALALGGNPVLPVLLGRLRLRGNPLALWQLRTLLRNTAAEE